MVSHINGIFLKVDLIEMEYKIRMVVATGWERAEIESCTSYRVK